MFFVVKDEIERFDIDDELMKNDQTTNERKVAEMKKVTTHKNILNISKKRFKLDFI